MSKNVVSLLLDSGAFGAWKRGIDLDLKAYIAFIKSVESHTYAYVNMDVIPGSMGRMIKTPESVEDSANRSYVNLQRMKDAGLSPIPVFHQGESWKWLDKLLEDGETYVGISPYLKSHRNEIKRWLDDCYSRITDAKGRPLVKTHGFGMTNIELMMRYPWRTSDSTSWAINYGTVMIPSCANGEPDYLKPINIHVSGGAPDAAKQLESLGPTMRKWVIDYLEGLGLSVSFVRNASRARRLANVKYFQAVGALAQNNSFQHGRLTPTKGKHKKHKFEIVFATTPADGAMTGVLVESKANARLLSYFDLMDMKNAVPRYQEYVETGGKPTFGEYANKRAHWNVEHYRSFRRLKLGERVNSNETGE